MSLAETLQNLRLALQTTLTLTYLCILHLTNSLYHLIRPPPPTILSGKTTLITGGAGGVGRQLALQLAKRGVRLILWDVDESALLRVSNELQLQGAVVHTAVVDISDRHSVHKHARQITEEFGPIDILVNNAGIVNGKPLVNLPEEDIERTFKVNILSHYWTTKNFLDGMLRRGSGHIVTVASAAGLIGTHLCTDYSATKFATIGFHESLLTELRTHGYRNIRTTVVCPYFVDTGMFAGVRPRLLPMLQPSYVASEIVTALEHNKTTVILPAALSFLLPFKYWLPADLCWDIMYKILQGPQAMSTFHGSKQPAAA